MAALVLAVAAAETGVGMLTVSQVAINLGAIVGSVADGLLLYPAIFGPEPIEGQRLGDLRLQGTREGEAKYRVYGTDRVPGQLIWQTDLREDKKSESGGKGPGGGGGFIAYTYFAHAAFEVCAHPTNRIKRIWADGKIFYNEEPDILVNSTSIYFEVEPIQFFPTGSTEYLVVKNDNGDVDLSKFKSGGAVELLGSSVPGNNSDVSSPLGYWTVVSSYKDPDDPLKTQVKLKHPTSLYTGFGADASTGEQILMRQELPLFKPSQVKSINFHYGDPNQVADPLIDKFESGAVPAYRERTTVVFEDLFVTDWGNRLPNFEFEVEESEDPLVRDVIARICKEAGLSESQYDVTGVAATKVLHGFSVRGPQPTSTILQPIGMAFDVLARQEGERIVFFDRENTPEITIAAGDLGTHSHGERAANPFEVRDDSELFKPRSLTVSHKDVFDDYGQGIRRAFNPTVETQETGQVNSPLAMEPGEAQAMATKLLFMQASARQECEGTLPYYYLQASEDGTREALTEGKIINTPSVMGDTWKILVERLEFGANFELRWRGRREDLAVLVQDEFADEAAKAAALEDPGGSQDTGSVHQGPAHIEWALLDVPNLSDEEADKLGVYVAACHWDPNVPWRGAALYMSTDSGTTWHKALELATEAIMGRVTAFGSTVVDPGFWDTTNTISIELYGASRSLSSVTEDECLAGRNRIAVMTSSGPEIIGFQTVTKTSTDPATVKYDLTNLIRGLRNTEDVMASHAAGDGVVVLGEVGLHFLPLNIAAMNAARQFKMVGSRQALIEVGSVTHTLVGGSLRPFQVSDIEITRDGSNNITVTWIRRSRGVNTLTGGNAPLLEEGRKYDVEFGADPWVSELREKTVTEESVTYTAAEQTADGLTPGNNITVRVYQVSARVGRGRMKQANG